MRERLAIEADWEHLDRGAPEERACFCALGIRHGDVWLTRADDAFVRRVREKVHLSGYGLAEWLAWNWWRLRYEPAGARKAVDWSLAHRLSSIGGGFVWPNVEIVSDGENVDVVARPTRQSPVEPLCYLADFAASVRAGELERAVDVFVEQVRGQLRAEGVAETNLDRLWSDVLEERGDPRYSLERRCEALLGYDPDEAPEAVLRALLGDGDDLGEAAVLEIAAGSEPGGSVLTGASLEETASRQGFDARPADCVRLDDPDALPRAGDGPAWLRGAAAASAVRGQLDLRDEPVDDARLAGLAAVETEALRQPSSAFGISFALDREDGTGGIVLRSKWSAGRRFELARLLGDRLLTSGDRLFPATGSYTYRQKQQRAFAAELLCPFELLDEWMGGDYSEDNQIGAAAHYRVSELLVRTQLVNNDRVPRDELDFQRR